MMNETRMPGAPGNLFFQIDDDHCVIEVVPFDCENSTCQRSKRELRTESCGVRYRGQNDIFNLAYTSRVSRKIEGVFHVSRIGPPNAAVKRFTGGKLECGKNRCVAIMEGRKLPPAVDQRRGRLRPLTDREQYQELLDRVRKRQVDVVLVYRYNRFARSTRELINALEEFRALDVDFIGAAQL